MAKAAKRLMPPAGGSTPVETFELEQFSRRLFQLMTDRGWSQSDLAREVWGERTNEKTGYKEAVNRDRISSYIRGRSYPDPKNLGKLAEALGVPPDELAPDVAAATVDRENPEFQMTAVAGHADKVLLKVNKLVPMPLAAKIAVLIADAD